MEENNIEFLFPFKPYDVQHEFMKCLYNILQEGNIGILESPTGTGKSLSIISGSLKWLTDYKLNKRKELEELLKEEVISNADDWFSSFAQQKEKSEERSSAKEELDFIEKLESKISNLRENASVQQKKCSSDKLKLNQLWKKLKRDDSNDSMLKLDNENDDDSDLLIEEDDDDLNDSLDSKEKCEKEAIKIIYASRTHSQLLQFMNEFKKSAYAKTVPITCLGSRTNLCVNDNVRNLKSHHLVNDKCSELLSKTQSTKDGSKATKSCNCPFYNKSNLKSLQNSILIESLDIEDLAKTGKELHACPYYATRGSIPEVSMVLVPYNILLHKATRESCGVKLKGNIVIIDEAHNLLDAINNMYSTKIDGIILQEAHKQLSRYHLRYKTRFSAKTIRSINMMLHILDQFLKYLRKPDSALQSKAEGNVTDVMPISKFLCDAKVDHINFFDVVRFCDSSHIGNKLHGFASKGSFITKDSNTKSSATSLLNLVKKNSAAKNVENNECNKLGNEVPCSWPSAFNMFVDFMKALTLPSNCGKIVCSKDSILDHFYFKLLHLNPAVHFSDIVKDTRAVILAGGTMTPISDFVEQLLVPAGANRDKILHYSFGHVVSKDNVKVLAVRSGIHDVTFDFTFESRQKHDLVKELGSVLLEVSRVVPSGVVCFFPSYTYEEFVYSILKKKGILTAIEENKTVFREPKDSKQTEQLLLDYAFAIRNTSGKKGALLFSVVGGKMSEGINFSDDLCRCVIMIGLPYAKRDKECLEKLSYIKQVMGGTEDSYTVMCMKAVNQSIGRAIRHKNDYAVIMLLDYRYGHNNILQYLPSWLSKNVSKPNSFDVTVLEVKNFFKR